MTAEPLVCPSCARTHGLDERFCADCGMPLVYSPGAADELPITDRHVRARKIKPQYAEGELLKVVSARNQSEAEFIQGLLLEEGVPSMHRRTRGFDVPEMLAAGPRDVLVPAAGLQTAREVLLQAEILDLREAAVKPARLAAGLLLAVALVGVIAWAGTELAI
jgi:hypothetical protein